ncbi:MAG TPA: pantetheine-phosphate adenylyltransferase [Candidatus Woesebacteria bacterium]|nr:pantetheine-phosphate adenylyltransferase [Candidatus Woesebacteria bacterium]
MSTAIYAFSGDPITYGHIDIIKRAAGVFDRLIVAVGVNPAKKYLFSLEERERLARQALISLKNVQVVSFTGLLIDFAYEMGADVIVKGVRNPTDFEYEAVLQQLGETQQLGIDTFILIAHPELAHVSSSAVKQIQLEQGLIHEYVPLNVKQAIEAKMSQQYIIAVTGEIGAGKSYVSQEFVKYGQQIGMTVHHIDLDLITRQIYQELAEPKYQQVRDTIAAEFGSELKNSDGGINRQKLGEIVFADSGKLQLLNQIMRKPLMVRIRRELYGKKGLILLNAALIIESQMCFLSSNHVCLIKTDRQSQYQRLQARQLSTEQIERRLASQYTFEQKLDSMKTLIDKSGFGQVWVVDNGASSMSDNISSVFEQVTSYFQLTAGSDK